jgi:hypothetical protein
MEGVWRLAVRLSVGENYIVRNFVFCTLQEVIKKPSGHYMYRQFNFQKFYVLPTHRIYVFCVDLRTNSDYFPIQH